MLVLLFADDVILFLSEWNCPSGLLFSTSSSLVSIMWWCFIMWLLIKAKGTFSNLKWVFILVLGTSASCSLYAVRVQSPSHHFPTGNRWLLLMFTQLVCAGFSVDGCGIYQIVNSIKCDVKTTSERFFGPLREIWDYEQMFRNYTDYLYLQYNQTYFTVQWCRVLCQSLEPDLSFLRCSWATVLGLLATFSLISIRSLFQTIFTGIFFFI